jgi:hypothetical protein
MSAVILITEALRGRQSYNLDPYFGCPSRVPSRGAAPSRRPSPPCSSNQNVRDLVWRDSGDRIHYPRRIDKAISGERKPNINGVLRFRELSGSCGALSAASTGFALVFKRCWTELGSAYCCGGSSRGGLTRFGRIWHLRCVWSVSVWLQ